MDDLEQIAVAARQSRTASSYIGKGGRKRSAIFWFGLGAVFCLLVCPVGVWLYLSTDTISVHFHQVYSPAPRSTPGATAARESGFTISRRTLGTSALTSAVWAIVNEDQRPLVVNRVRYNGEHDARPALCLSSDPLNGGYGPDPDEHFPIVLTIGDVAAFVEYTPHSRDPGVSYRKVVLYVDIYTDRGNFRYRSSGGFELLP